MSTSAADPAPPVTSAVERTGTRRRHLAVRANPSPGIDYVISYEGRLESTSPVGEAALELRYVPDRLVLEEHAFADYLIVLSGEDYGTLEEAAAILLDDLNNELVARWLHLSLSVETSKLGTVRSHHVALEDRQPGWKNGELMERLRPF